ncbi:MAG TPA: dephospho-CoA kinase [Rhabdochlamydiaceae bacterium]|nr:dephospho-CoA kinase [Rhabdochlamydiaceae bacterium]
MLTLKKVAVTGGLASGKTSVCRILESCGAYVISADQVVHKLLSPNHVIGQQVISLLGSDVSSEKQIDRSKVAEIVFSNPEKLQALENLIHPAVLDEIERCYQEISKEKNYPLFIAEIPLLYESESENMFDAVISVIADESVCKERFQKSTGYSASEFNRRMARQHHPEQKAAAADYVLFNNGDFEQLKDQVSKIYPMLISN